MDIREEIKKEKIKLQNLSPVERAIRELRESYELKHRDWAYRCLDTIQAELEKKDKELEEAKRETQQVLDDYQDLGKEKYKLECEEEKKDKIIKLMVKWMAGGNSFMHATEEQVIEKFTDEVEKEGK